MIIGIGQIRCSPAGLEANLAKIRHLIGEAADHGAELVVLPEFADTGYDFEAISQAASTARSGSFAALRHAARSAKIAVACGVAERAAGGVYSSIALFDAKGRHIGSYRKIHLFRSTGVDESILLKAGKRLMIRRLGGFDAGFCVCYDLRFPELTRSLALAGAQMLIVAAAWPAARREHWKTLIRARAIENQCYVLAANRAGSDRGLRFCGASCVVGPRGEILAEASGSKEQVVLATLDPNSVQSARRQMPVLEHCRVSLRMRLS